MLIYSSVNSINVPNIIKLVIAFAPWLSFLIISGHSMFRLKLSIIVAICLVVMMGIMKTHRGIILWSGVLFFTYALIAVVIFNHMWSIRHMGILANGALALGTWTSILMKKPFTIDYAKDHVDPAQWDSPSLSEPTTS